MQLLQYISTGHIISTSLESFIRISRLVKELCYFKFANSTRTHHDDLCAIFRQIKGSDIKERCQEGCRQSLPKEVSGFYVRQISLVGWPYCE